MRGDQFSQECVARAPRRMIATMAERQVNEATNERCSIASLIVCGQKTREVLQEIASLSMSKPDDALTYLERTRDDMRKVGYNARNPYLFDFYGTHFRTSTDKVADASLASWEYNFKDSC